MRKAGEVTYGAAHDGEVGKNRGIVCFERKKDAERAVDDLDGRELNGRTVSSNLLCSFYGLCCILYAPMSFKNQFRRKISLVLGQFENGYS